MRNEETKDIAETSAAGTTKASRTSLSSLFSHPVSFLLSPLSFLISPFSFIISISLLSSCGAPSGHFRIEGHLLKMNQGEFLVYSPDGVINGIDTIRLNGGRFNYEIPCEEEGTLMIVFPNFTEYPVFAESGKSVSLSADASHLNELTVKGTKDNELLSGFRKQTNDASPDETLQLAGKFVENNPKTAAAVYVFRKYFIQDQKTNIKEGTRLMALLKDSQKDNLTVSRMETEFSRRKASAIDEQLPSFAATDIKGQRVSKSTLSGAVGVISTFASWSYESQEQQRQLRRMARKYGGRLKLVSINLDASKSECQKIVRRDSLSQPLVCDEQMFDSPILLTLGISNVPDNIVVDKSGKIVARGMNIEDLKKRLEELLK